MWDICFHLHSEFLWGRGEAVGQVGKLASEARYIPHLALLAKIPSIPIGILGILTKDEGPKTIRFGRPPAPQDISSGRTIRWLGANNPTPGLRKTRPNRLIYSIYRAQEVYPLSPLLGGGFPKEGGTACRANNNNNKQTTIKQTRF